MGKYGNGVSMRTEIESEVMKARKILDHSGLDPEDRQCVIGSLKEMAYQWCSVNASFCALEAHMKAEFPEEYTQLLSTFLRSPVYNSTYTETMQRTYPY